MQGYDDNLPAPMASFSECLLPQGFMTPNDAELIDLASSFDVKHATSAMELKNFADLCSSTRRRFGPQNSTGIEALELKVIQCEIMLMKKFTDFATVKQKGELEEPEEHVKIDVQAVKNTWLDRVEADNRWHSQR